MPRPTFPVHLSLGQAELGAVIDGLATLVKLQGQSPAAHPGFRSACRALLIAAEVAGVTAEQLEHALRPDIGDRAWNAFIDVAVDAQPQKAPWLN